MKLPRVLIIGASARAATQSAVTAGFDTVAADLFADRDTQSIARCHQVTEYPAELARIRRRYADLPLIYTGAMENYPALLSEMESIGPFWGNSAKTVKQVRDPRQLQRVFNHHDVPFPQTLEACPSAAGWLQKSMRSAGGQQVRKVSFLTKTGLSKRELVRDERARGEHVYYQEFIAGQPCSGCFVAHQGQSRLLGVTNMLVGCDWLNASGFSYCGSFTRRSKQRERSQWERIGEVLTSEFALEGIFGVDAIATPTEEQENPTIMPLEVNPRYTASMEVIERSRGISIMGQHIRSFLEHDGTSRRTAVRSADASKPR